jgi:Ca2+/H+ antiporter
MTDILRITEMSSTSDYMFVSIVLSVFISLPVRVAFASAVQVALITSPVLQVISDC